MSYLLYMRLLQGKRILLELGLLRSALLFIATGLLFFQYAYLEGTLTAKIYVLLSIFVLLFSLHNFRRDKRFLLELQLGRLEVYLSEYLLLWSPWMLISLMKLDLIFVLGIPLIVLIVSLIPEIQWPRGFSLVFHWNLFLSSSIEWMSGVRKNIVALGLFFLITGIFCYSPLVSLLFLLVFTGFVTSFYGEGESLVLLRLYQSSAQAFLKHKIGIQLKYYFVFTGLFQLLFLVFNLSYWYVWLIINLICLILLILSVLLKYSYYEPDCRLPMVRFFISISYFCLLIPFLSPIPLVLTFYFYRKAIKNLKYYLL